MMDIMYHHNSMPLYGNPLDPATVTLLGDKGADAVADILALRDTHKETPLVSLPALAGSLGVGSIHLKDEGHRLGLGSFKALGGAYALIKLVQKQASERLGRPVPTSEILAPATREIASDMVFACATDGNHGRSVAQGAQLVGATAVIFVHSGVSKQRIDAIAQFGAHIIRVAGNYDDSVAEAARVATQKGWTILSDTSWPGYEDIPGLVMQGYTILAREAVCAMPASPTHVFLQAGVGGFAAAIAAYLAIRLGSERPHITIVEPQRAACLYESAIAGQTKRIHETEPTIMAMLECYEPSMIAMNILERIADGFMTVEEEAAPAIMRRLAHPLGADPAIISGESGGVGLAGLVALLRDQPIAQHIHLGPSSRILVINTEGATDPELYHSLVGQSPQAVLKGRMA